MTYSQIEDYSLSLRDIQDVMDSLQPHISHTEIKVQKLSELCSILISYSPEKLFCKRGRNCTWQDLLPVKPLTVQLVLLTAKLRLLRSQYIPLLSVSYQYCCWKLLHWEGRTLASHKEVRRRTILRDRHSKHVTHASENSCIH